MTEDNKNYEVFQKLATGTNINPQTLLATDYLNHFNEIHMLLGMIAEMPDCIEDILEWETKSYQQHFEESGFQDKKLAIEAYEFSPDKYKLVFEDCVAMMDELLLNTISQTAKALNDKKLDEVNLIVSSYSPRMEEYIRECSAIINSKEITAQQNNIDDFFDENSPEDATELTDQSAIDDLFD